MNEIQLHALNEAKKDLWAAKEPLKKLGQKISCTAGLYATSFAEVIGTLETAISSLSSLGERLRQLEKGEEARS